MTGDTGQHFTLQLPDACPLLANAAAVIQTLRKAGFDAFVVGGAVRDLARGIPPKEYDIATSASPEAVTALFAKTIQVGARFGVVRVRLHGHEFEVATFRTESSYSDGRRPDVVEYSDLASDVARRDFTINGLVMDPLTGEGLDLVGGLEDLRAGIVRAIGHAPDRFEEDHLRMLRAVRFAAQTGFVIDPSTFDAIRDSAALVTSVSRERLREELEKILASPRPGHGLRLLDASGLLPYVLPEWNIFPGAVVSTATCLEQLTSASPAVLWATLLWDLGPDGAEAALQRLRQSNQARECVTSSLRAIPAILSLPDQDLAREKRLLRQSFIPFALDALAVRLSVSRQSSAALDYARSRLLAWKHEDLFPTRLVTGHDAQALGLQNSAIAQGLKAVEDAQLRGDIREREQAINLLQSLAKIATLTPKRREVT